MPEQTMLQQIRLKNEGVQQFLEQITERTAAQRESAALLIKGARYGEASARVMYTNLTLADLMIELIQQTCVTNELLAMLITPPAE